jgi:hypothetical protein
LCGVGRIFIFTCRVSDLVCGKQMALKISAWHSFLIFCLLILLFVSSTRQIPIHIVDSQTRNHLPSFRCEQNSKVVRCRLYDIHNKPVTYRLTFEYLIQSADFRREFIATLLSSNFNAFFWECPPFSNLTVSEVQYEFVLIETEVLLKKRPDKSKFSSFFSKCANDVTHFSNIGGDAHLVVPCPILNGENQYGHFAEFLRNAPLSQIDYLLQVVGSTGLSISQTSRGELSWLSTSGAGVQWLHIRFDSVPKYYNWLEYKKES